MAIILVDIQDETPSLTNSEIVKLIDFVPVEDTESVSNDYHDDRFDAYTDLNKAIAETNNTGTNDTSTPSTKVKSSTVNAQEPSSQIKKEKVKEKSNDSPHSAPVSVQKNIEILSEINKVIPDAQLAILIKKAMAIPEIPQYVKEIIPIIVKEPHNLNTAGRLAHFFGQIHVETKWNPKSEGVDYKGSRLKDVFGRQIKDKDEAIKLGINGSGARPNEIGGWPDIIYGSRIENERQGNKYNTLDGYKYRGHGLLQVSFKNPYYTLMTKLYPTEDFIKNPDKMNEPKWALISSLLWWSRHKNLLIDEVNDSTILIVSKAVNGHTHNLKDRIKFTHNYYNKLK